MIAFDPVVADLAGRAAPGLIVETVEPMLGEALAPRAHGLPRDTDRIGDRAVALPVCGPQHDLGTQRLGTRDFKTPHAPLEGITLLDRELDRLRHPPRHANPPNRACDQESRRQSDGYEFLRRDTRQLSVQAQPLLRPRNSSCRRVSWPAR
jgi:hypothetical protein